MNYHNWTKEEASFLIENYLKFNNKKLSEYLKLSKDIVRDKMYKMKLKRPEELVSEWRSEMSKGSNNNFYGKNHSKEAREKISNKAKGRKISETTRIKLSKLLSGKGNPRYGTHGWNLGIPHTKEHSLKISLAQMGGKKSHVERR